MTDNEKHSSIEKIIDEVLTTSPKLKLSDDFAERVAEKASYKLAWSQYLKEFFLYLGLALLVAVAAMAITVFWFRADWKAWLDFATEHLSIIIATAILLVFILFADRVLLRYFMYRSEMEPL